LERPDQLVRAQLFASEFLSPRKVVVHLLYLACLGSAESLGEHNTNVGFHELG
jgi:hypothetical protein